MGEKEVGRENKEEGREGRIEGGREDRGREGGNLTSLIPTNVSCWIGRLNVI